MRHRVYIFLVSLLFSLGAFAAPSTQRAQSPAVVIQLRGEINNSSKDYFITSFKDAVYGGAKTVIIDMDTYGGLVSSALEISHFIKSWEDVHTIAYINSKAYSAGSMISFACNEIVMAPASAIGDCAPIQVGPTGQVVTMGKDERAKAVSPIIADFRDSCARNNHNVALAEAMVTSDIELHWLKNTTTLETRFVDKALSQTLLDSKEWVAVAGNGIPNPLDSSNTLLTIDANLALKTGLASSIAPSIDELVEARALHVSNTYEYNLWYLLVDFLNSPAVRSILITLFLTCLYISLSAPGHGAAEVSALLAFVLLIGAPSLTGYAQWWEIVIIFIGIVLLAVELFIIPGFGVAGISGIILIILGLVLTFVAPEAGKSPFSFPGSGQTWNSLQTGLIAVVSAVAVSMIAMALLRPFLPKLPLFRRLILNTAVGTTPAADAGSISNIDPASQSPAPGAKGVALTDLCPGGSAEFTDLAGAAHVVSVLSGEGFIPKNSPIVVKEVVGPSIHVVTDKSA